MNLTQFIKEYKNFCKELNLTNKEAHVGAGGTLLLLGLREQTNDIDMDVFPVVFNKIRKMQLPETVLNNGTVVIKYNQYIDVHKALPGLEYTVIKGVGSYTAEQVLKQKLALNREKDQEDIRKLKEYLKSHKTPLYSKW